MEENEEDGQDQIKYLDAGMFHLHTLAFILNYWFCSRIYIHILVCCSKEVYPTTTTGIRAVRARYMPLLWPVPQSGAAVEHNDVILSLGHTDQFLVEMFHNYAFKECISVENLKFWLLIKVS